MVIRNDDGELASAGFRFNGWGKKYDGWQDETQEHLTVKVFREEFRIGFTPVKQDFFRIVGYYPRQDNGGYEDQCQAGEREILDKPEGPG